ncbi:hypothetical protein [Nocardia niwae]
MITIVRVADLVARAGLRARAVAIAVRPAAAILGVIRCCGTAVTALRSPL